VLFQVVVKRPCLTTYVAQLTVIVSHIQTLLMVQSAAPVLRAKAPGWFLLIPFACECQSKKKPARGGLDLVRNVICPGYLRLADALRRRPATNNKASIVRTIP